MSVITKAQVAEALRRSAQKSRWGEYTTCHLCLLFQTSPTVAPSHDDCITCSEAVGLWAPNNHGCTDWTPPGCTAVVIDYINELDGVGHPWPGLLSARSWRTQADDTLLSRATELEAEHNAEQSVQVEA